MLSNFSNFVQAKYKNEKIVTSIQQDGNVVVLTIKSENGELKERIEEELYSYGLVVSGEKPVEWLTDDKYRIAELNQQLRLARVQLENQKELLMIERTHSIRLENKQKDTEEQYKEMMKIMSVSMSNKNSEVQFLRELASNALSTQSKTARQSLKVMIEIIQSGEEPRTVEEIIEHVNVVKTEDPRAYRRMVEFTESCGAGVVGNSLFSFILNAINSLPK